MTSSYDIIVVGGGHAGAEAAWAATRMGASVALVTMDHQAIGRMSCNPAIGGLGKGQMVREIDALGGLMALATDRAGIQFRMLNRSKGPAVWAPRAQCDRSAYPMAVQQLLAGQSSLHIVQGAVASLLTRDQTLPDPQSRNEQAGASRSLDEDTPTRTPTRTPMRRRRVIGVALEGGTRIMADAVILTTGTFLGALMHCGTSKTPGGRVGENAATNLSNELIALGFELRRLKTGTPPRVHRDTVDYTACTEQPADDLPVPFSFMTDVLPQRQVCCWITWTNARVHDAIRANLHRAPMYSGQIQSTGPRYCPSIEDKVVRFADKQRHQVFLEPEGYDDERIYCNGISTSLPADVQDLMIRDIDGLHAARILQYGYAVEYDSIPSHQTRCTLETKLVDGLFVAGQINGTSGYEEAAAQGLVAGVNAVCRLRGDDPLVLGRDEAYIGVMIDDLITRPPDEPYRMFTSRAEYRLVLRADNADRRLTARGRALGLVDDDRWSRFLQKRDALDRIESLARDLRVEQVALANWVRRPDVDVAALAAVLCIDGARPFCTDALAQYLVSAKYQGYVERQQQQIERFRRLEKLVIPESVEYARIDGMRREARERLARVAPRTLGQAARITGITPSDITVLWIHINARRSAVPAA